MKNKLNLPKKYKSAKGDKYPQYDGKPYLSYSQISSINSTEYANQYILGYIFGIEQPSNKWADLGSQVGEYLETSGEKIGDMLSENDIKVLDGLVEQMKDLPNKEFERKIVLDLGDFIIIGYIDLYHEKDGKSNVVDFKTLSLKNDKKSKFYGSSEYQQTRLYLKSLKEDGLTIGDCGVIGIGRNFEGTFEDPELSLSGEIVKIPTPYSEKEVSIFIEKAKDTAQYVSDLNTTFQKLNSIKITV